MPAGEMFLAAVINKLLLGLWLGFPYRLDPRALPIRVFAQHGAPDLCSPPDDRDHLSWHETGRWDGDHRQEGAAVGLGWREVLDVIKGSDGAIGLGRAAGYFDTRIGIKPEDLNGKDDTVIVPEFDFCNSGMRHGRNLSNGCLLGNISERPPDSRKVAFALVQIKSLGGCGVRFSGTAGGSEDVSEVEQGVGVLA